MRKVDGWWIPRFDDGGKHPVFRRQRAGNSIITRTMPHVHGRRTVVQAGGHLGYWAVKLSEHFRTVITFEPDKDNYECLRLNTKFCPNVSHTRAALGDKRARVAMGYADDSTGKHYVEESGLGTSTKMEPIDRLERNDIDAIFLDIEGYELFALQGATETIEHSKPVIVVEENAASKRYGVDRQRIRDFLAGFGYKEAGRYKYDHIYTAV